MGEDGRAGAGPRVLVVEDDATVREALQSALGNEGYDVRAHVDGGQLTRTLAADGPPDLAVLDVRLPDGPTGLEIAQQLRSLGDVPILFLTAADAVTDRLAGFRAGADDYVVKPFVMAELLARVRALLRRSGRLEGGRTLRVGDLELDTELRTAICAGAPVSLTRTEFDLLGALMRHPDKVLSKSQLLSLVWAYDEYDANLVEVHVSALRRKLEQYAPRVIHTVRGFGYVLRT